MAGRDERHRIPGLEQQVQLGDLLREGDKHRPPGHAHLQQEPILLALLAQDLALKPLALPADRLGQVPSDESWSHGRSTDTKDDSGQECKGHRR